MFLISRGEARFRTEGGQLGTGHAPGALSANRRRGGASAGEPSLPWAADALSFPAAQLVARRIPASVSCWVRGATRVLLRRNRNAAADGTPPLGGVHVSLPVGATPATVAAAVGGSDSADGTCGENASQDAAAAGARPELDAAPKRHFCGDAGGVNMYGKPCRHYGSAGGGAAPTPRRTSRSGRPPKLTCTRAAKQGV